MEMCKWGEDTRKQDHGYFCRAAIDMYNGKMIQFLMTTKLADLFVL